MEDVTIKIAEDDSDFIAQCNVCKHKNVDNGFRVLNRTKICVNCLEELILWFADFRRFRNSTTKEYF